MNDEARRTLAAIASTSVPPSWRQQTMPSLFSALMGGLVAWIVCWFCTPNPNAPIDKLEVGSLIVTDRLTVRAPGNDGDAMLVKDGSLFVKNRVVATQFLGSQIASSIIVANRQLTTPDDLFKVPADQWRFHTEVGASDTDGGEILVRSRAGGSSVTKSMNDGTCIRIGFDAGETTQMVAYSPKTNSTLPLLSRRRFDSTNTSTDTESAVATRSGRHETGAVAPPIASPVVAEPTPQIASQYTPTTTVQPPPALPTLAPPLPVPTSPLTTPSHWE
ncbi:MAG: hypothetical protein ACRC46_01670 [Thermoguttaceae bacterium]